MNFQRSISKVNAIKFREKERHDSRGVKTD